MIKFFVSAIALSFWASGCLAETLTVAGSGGATQTAFRAAVFKPFTAETGIEIVEDEWDYKLGTLRAQIESGAVKWDVIDVTRNILLPGCEEEFFEPVDWSKIPDKADISEKGAHKCGLGGPIAATVLVYDGKRFAEPPTSWADFWDLEKFPGKRGLWYNPVEVLEFALLADGVAKADVYTVLATPEGLDRAFAKLDQIKPSIVWWRSGAESVQRLASGEVAMTSAWNGRPILANRDNPGLDLKIAWKAGALRLMDYWVVLKGTQKKEAAEKFLAFLARPDIEAAVAKIVPYGGPNMKMEALLDESVLKNLPTSPQNMKDGFDSNYEFWLEHQDRIVERFNNWAAH